MSVRALACAAAIVLSGCASDRMPPASPIEQLDRELAAIANDLRRPLASLSVLAIRDGRAVYERQFGRRHIDPDLPADAATLFRIASISKLVTTLGVLKLVEDGKLSLDADLGTYLGYRLRNPRFPDAPITLRMILTHTSSLRDEAGYHGFDPGLDLRDFLTPGGPAHGKGAMWAANAKPGEFFSYANLPWGVAATAMEKVTGERFDRLMRRLVLDPLGMRGGYNPGDLPGAGVANIATLYRKATAGDKQVWNPAGPWIAQIDDYSQRLPASREPSDPPLGTNGLTYGPQGGLRASAADLGRLMLMLIGGGEIEGKRVLKRETVDILLATHWKRGDAQGEADYGSRKGRFNAWGLGNQKFLDVSGPGFGDRLVEGGGFVANGHLGDAYGLMATLAFDPKTRNGLVVLVGGTGFDPDTDRGAYSSAARFEERIVTALYRRAIQGRAD